jgi:hypothetical protein
MRLGPRRPDGGTRPPSDCVLMWQRRALEENAGPAENLFMAGERR